MKYLKTLTLNKSHWSSTHSSLMIRDSSSVLTPLKMARCHSTKTHLSGFWTTKVKTNLHSYPMTRLCSLKLLSSTWLRRQSWARQKWTMCYSSVVRILPVHSHTTWTSVLKGCARSVPGSGLKHWLSSLKNRCSGIQLTMITHSNTKWGRHPTFGPRQVLRMCSNNTRKMMCLIKIWVLKKDLSFIYCPILPIT